MLSPLRVLRRLAQMTALIASCSVPVYAATITVTNPNDDFSVGTLRRSVANAQAGDTINFNLTYPAVIRFVYGVRIDKNLTISGPGSDQLRLDGNFSDQFFMFTITPGATATVRNVQISASNALAIDNQGNLTLNDSVVSYNQLSLANTGTLTVNHTAFTNNLGANWGGAIKNYGQATINRSLFSHNDARIGGAAIFTDTNATLQVNDSAFVSNGSGSFAHFGAGGALLNWGTSTVNNSTFSNNVSGPVGTGGAMENTGTLTVNSSTISRNVAMSGGSGIANTSGTTTLRRTIVDDSCIGSTLTSAGDNRGSDSTCFANSAALNDSQSLDLQLGTLGNHGGATPTIALLPGSPAIDAVIVNAAGCSGTDQRGVARPLGVRCDTGAFERNPGDIFANGFE
ncbi:MAG: choice-of-anchor Q domain-containing protein [Tahibacter sp.]